MATAPTPGVGKRKAQAAEAVKLLKMVYDGIELPLAWQNLSMKDKRDCKVQTGATLERWLDDIGDVTFVVLWWLARRVNGEPHLSYLVCENEFDGTKLGLVDFEAEGGDDPEA
jgi:hypothetical protein